MPWAFTQRCDMHALPLVLLHLVSSPWTVNQPLVFAKQLRLTPSQSASQALVAHQ